MRDYPPTKRFKPAIAMTAFVLTVCAQITAAPPSVYAQERAATASEQHAVDTYIAEAARRFGMPRHWIRAVMEVESAGNPMAVSRAGAMGLMQIMPATWVELRAQLQLADDPFDPRDNIHAGTAYLRQMYDRFGTPGFLAAYNAGPARYQDHLDTGRALPRETRNYLAVLAPIIDSGPTINSTVTRQNRTHDWRNAPLFTVTADGTDPRPDRLDPTGSEAAEDDIFVPLSRVETP
jgi:soluble lytic murein transglycosylase-like protein